jgi:hypothetical protein
MSVSCCECVCVCEKKKKTKINKSDQKRVRSGRETKQLSPSIISTIT